MPSWLFRPSGWPATAVVLGVLALWPAPALGQRVNLNMQPTSITFQSADPDLTPTITAQAIVVRYRVQNNAGGSWRLTVLASGDLISGLESIDISSVSWTATPSPPFQAGTLSKTVQQTVASGSGNVNPQRTGTLVFRLVNSWDYSVGTYTQTFIFTLSAP
jgi:hypothetical protein